MLEQIKLHLEAVVDAGLEDLGQGGRERNIPTIHRWRSARVQGDGGAKQEAPMMSKLRYLSKLVVRGEPPRLSTSSHVRR